MNEEAGEENVNFLEEYENDEDEDWSDIEDSVLAMTNASTSQCLLNRFTLKNLHILHKRWESSNGHDCHESRNVGCAGTSRQNNSIAYNIAIESMIWIIQLRSNGLAMA